MPKPMPMLAALCGAIIAGAALIAGAASAETVTRSWVGPNGGSLAYRGDGVPGHYRGAVTVTTPQGDVYRRVTRIDRGPDGATVSRRWVGPNGAAFARGRIRY
jgi:hypothetical protein